eukprot:gene19594-21522_t
MLCFYSKKYDGLGWITLVPISIPVCILGLIGNILSIFVWRRFIKKKIGSSQTSSVYFIALGAVDSGLLIFFFLTNSLKELGGDDSTGGQRSFIDTYAYNWFFSYVGFPVFFFFIVASIWVTVGLTVNRFIVVRFPVQARNYCSVKRTYVAIAAILAFCFIINFPHFFNYAPGCDDTGPVTADRRCSHWASVDTAYAKRGSAVQYEFWVHCMFLVLAPWATIAVLNAWIIVTLLRSTKGFKQLHEHDNDNKAVDQRKKQDRQITKVLLTVTFAFLILLAWQCINQCFFMLKVGKNTHPDNWKLVESTYDFARLGVVLNSSINCFLYCFSGSTFRRELARLFHIDVKEDSTTNPTPLNS